jgi:predicted CXXCH cytochrome family protein
LKKVVFLGALLVIAAGMVQAQVPTVPTTDVMGTHDMGSGGQSPVKGALSTCQYCHAPHSGLHGVAPLWSQKLSASSYTMYTSDTLVNLEQQPPLGSSSNLCLSCHDGTVAPGQTTPYGNTTLIQKALNPQDVITNFNGGTLSLQGVHPFNFKLPLNCDTDNLLASLCVGKTSNSAVKLIGGNVECNTCHEPHVQGIDSSNMFLVMNNTGSALCLTCHLQDPGQTSGMALHQLQTKNAIGGTAHQGTGGTYSPFSGWATSAHSLSTSKVTKGVTLGDYGNMRLNGCLSCHTPHNAPGGKELLTAPLQVVPNMDAATKNCMTCHNGGSNVSPAIPNVYAEFAKTAGHPFPTGGNLHTRGESEVLDKNRHATCVDCHDAHASMPTGSFAATTIRSSQRGATGISAADGVTKVLPATNQYETCLRCHGTSSGKQVLAVFGYLPTREVTAGDPLNVIPQFSMSAKSSHPVMHDRDSSMAQPSLRSYMLNLDGHTPGRAMGPRILCSDCHNSDDNREFGGTGPNGPHGSKYPHIIERRYEFSQVAPGVAPSAGPGSAIQNLLPAISDPAAGGPYSLCAKCHDLTNILANASFSQHKRHIEDGFSCSVCHSAHGTSSSTLSTSGQRLVNFDLAVVAPIDGSKLPIAYNPGTSTCTLKCHNHNHSPSGMVALSGAATTVTKH